MRGDSAAVFSISGPGLPDLAPSIAGLWATAPAPFELATGDLAFGASVPPGDDPLVWRVNLPNDARIAALQLASAEARVRAQQHGLTESAERIAAIVMSQHSSPSFDVTGSETAWPEPEAELLSALRARSSGDQPTAFAAGQTSPGAGQSVQALLEQAARFMSNYAWVETEMAGREVGRTVVGWTGNVSTVWAERLDRETLALHHRALRLALESRATFIRTCAMAFQGAALLATLPVLLATPAGAILALPSAWKFVNQILMRSNDFNRPTPS